MSRAVIDQPGMRIIVVGLALSVFLGLAVRSQISETRIQGYLAKPIDRLKRDFLVDYEVARVNLSSWGLPLPALVIQNIRISPKNPLCQNSQIFIDELEVPISLTAILGLSNKVPKVRARSVELRLADIEKCTGGSESPQIENSANVSFPSTAAAPEADVKDMFAKKTRAELKEIYIEKWKIISNKKPDQPVLLRQVSLDFSYADSRLQEMILSAKINALKDPKSDLYFLNANAEAVFKSVPGNQLESFVNLKGKMLDGDTQLFLHSISGTNKISYEWDVDHVSLRALLPFFSSLDASNQIDFERVPTAISFKNSGEVSLSGETQLEAKFKQLLLNVGSGALKAEEIKLSSRAGRTRLEPFALQVNLLSLTQLKNLSILRAQLDSFENLGELSGVLNFRDEQHFTFLGDIYNIQTVFSNRGRRDLQNIDRADIEITRASDELKIRADQFVLNEKNVPGRFEARHFFSQQKTEAQLKIFGALFGAKIWEQFTFVEQSPDVDILWNYRKSGSETHDVSIRVENLALPGVEVRGLQIEMLQVFAKDPRENRLSLSARPTRVLANQAFLEQPVVSQILSPAQGFKMKSLLSNRTNLVFTGSDWKNVKFALDSHFPAELNARSDMHLNLQGAAEFQRGVTGRLILQSRNQNLRFDLNGAPDGQVTVRQVK